MNVSADATQAVEAVRQLVRGVTTSPALNRPMQIVNAFAERFSELAPEPQHFPEWCTASAEPYGRHLLYQCAATGVAAHLIVWEPGQGTPIHDHGDVEWGFLYCMAGELTVTNYEVGDFEAATSRAELQAASRMKLQAGCYDALVSTRPTVHSLQNKGKTTAFCINIYAEKIESYRVFRSGKFRVHWSAREEDGSSDTSSS